MIAGNPDTFAVITEKVANWRTDKNVSGMLHVCINGVAYPRKPRATDVENDILRLYDEQTSAFSHPKVSRKLFGMKGKKLFKKLMKTAALTRCSSVRPPPGTMCL